MKARNIRKTGQYSKGFRWWFNLLGKLLHPWVSVKLDPDPATIQLDKDAPVCYIIERSYLSNRLILERACREAGLPSSCPDPENKGLTRGWLHLIDRTGWFYKRPYQGQVHKQIEHMLHALDRHEVQDIQFVPVAIYIGRAPGRRGWFRTLFSEDWTVVGRFRRLLSLLLNGRETLVHVSKPISLRQVLDESSGQPTGRTSRKIARVLRVHFRRVRASIIGPDLSHRRNVVGRVLNAEPVREAISQLAHKDHVSEAKVRKKAQRMVREIAADYSHTCVRSGSFALSWFWNRLYDGISMYHFARSREASSGHEVVYVPCHRSHADYLLLSYQLYESGVVIPHIAAGINLNLPVLGSVLRRGGAFFIRRSFRGSALYSTVFKEYMAQLLAQGVPLEYFIEGGRSRTGRLLKPRGGVVSMTLRAFLRAPDRPVIFQPVYIGYERLMEGKSYASELSGKPKQKESWLALLKSTRKILKQRYGHVALSFGEPIELSRVLDECTDSWRDHAATDDTKPKWLSQAVDTLSNRIHVNINAAAHVNAINLLALVLLSTRKHAIAESDLRAQIALIKDLLEQQPYTDRVTVTTHTPDDIIARGEAMGWIRRMTHPRGDVLVTEGEKAVLLSYFRNNILHLVVCAAWVAGCFLNNRRMSRASILKLGRVVYPFLQSELFLRWDEATFEHELNRTLDFFIERGLLHMEGDKRLLARGDGQSDSTFQLKLLARCLIQVFERYYIVIATLATHEQGTLGAGELEKMCIMTAQRISLLHELNAPEFFDKALFHGFIKKLRERGVIWSNASSKLEFDPGLYDVVEDAGVILSRDLRHSVLKITSFSHEDNENSTTSANT